MKLGHDGEIKYDLTNGTITRYVLVLDGEVTMAVQCDTAAADRAIKILTPDGNHCLTTKGRFEMGTKFLEDSDGMPLGVQERVDSKSVYKYVVPRLRCLMGRLLRAAAA